LNSMKQIRRFIFFLFFYRHHYIHHISLANSRRRTRVSPI
jgi:hypothetical protein